MCPGQPCDIKGMDPHCWTQAHPCERGHSQKIKHLHGILASSLECAQSSLERGSPLLRVWKQPPGQKGSYKDKP